MYVHYFYNCFNGEVIVGEKKCVWGRKGDTRRKKDGEI
jgi:hypothetical protein